jgi:hypothetical protein
MRDFMCSECIQIDRKIEHLRTLALRLSDQQTLNGIADLIAELEAKKLALHPQQKNGPGTGGGSGPLV